METDLVVLEQFCVSHELEVSFVRDLEQQGLIDIVENNETLWLSPNDLPKLEQLVRLHQELHISPSDMDIIHHLLEHIGRLQDEVQRLRNRLNFFER